MSFPHPPGAHGSLSAVLFLPEPFRRRGKGGFEPALSDSAGATAQCGHGQVCPVPPPVHDRSSAGTGHDAPGQPGLPLQMVSGLQMEPGSGLVQLPGLWDHEPGHVSPAFQNGIPKGESLGILRACGVHLPDLHRGAGI